MVGAILDLYSDYLLVSIKKAMAIGLSESGGGYQPRPNHLISCRRRTGQEIFVVEDKKAGTPI
jgi:hypothetical protein